MKSTRRLGVVVVLALALTGCGSAPSTSDSAAGAVRVTDANGTQSLKAPAKRVVALEWSYGEDLLALGVQPVGVADIAGYNTWVTAGSRFVPSTKDVGKRQEPSLDAIYQLKPDLIVTDADRVTPNSLAALKKIAPTLVFDAYVKPDHLTGALNSFRQLGTAVGRTSQAQAVVGRAARQRLRGRQNSVGGQEKSRRERGRRTGVHHQRQPAAADVHPQLDPRPDRRPARVGGQLAGQGRRLRLHHRRRRGADPGRLR
ncbi:ABC transporter substrate-binding protein [Fodinicola feengrottensis]|uniref:ABC transporter substrate-binding protein n=1 Tax=Fodinicola feengrottensis TaxID=435914 RepID=UPI0013D47B06|nr:ABC transporter substrate-binding protein [Fodinicola feengrottensis]